MLGIGARDQLRLPWARPAASNTLTSKASIEAAEQPGDGGDVPLANLLAHAAQAHAHHLPEAVGDDELHVALAVSRLLVRQNPDLGGDARVAEHVGRQADDGSHCTGRSQEGAQTDCRSRHEAVLALPLFS